jgi:hypothetical protein
MLARCLWNIVKSPLAFYFSTFFVSSRNRTRRRIILISIKCSIVTSSRLLAAFFFHSAQSSDVSSRSSRFNAIKMFVNKRVSNSILCSAWTQRGRRKCCMNYDVKIFKCFIGVERLRGERGEGERDGIITRMISTECV